MEQGQQTITIQYVGETVNNKELLGTAAIAALTVIAKNGYFVNAEVNPTVHNFTETETAKVIAAIASKSKSNGVTVKIEAPYMKPVYSDEDKKVLSRVFGRILNG